MIAEVSAALELEARRCRLLERGDIDSLAAMLDSELVYVHATGVVHGRAQWLDFLRSSVRFESIERRGLRGVLEGAVILLTGLMRLDGHRTQTGEAFASSSFVSQVWRLYDDGAWRLRLFQSTRIDDKMWDNKAAVTAAA